jgi:hypothetical protein
MTLEIYFRKEPDTMDSAPGGTLTLADDLTVSRMGYGAMRPASAPHRIRSP